MSTRKIVAMFPPFAIRTALDGVERWLRLRDVKWRPLLCTSLSTVLDPQKFPGQFASITETVVPMVLIESEQVGRFARFVVLDEDDMRSAALLSDVGIAHVRGWADDETGWSLLDAARMQPCSMVRDKARRIGNASELALRTRTQETVGAALNRSQKMEAGRSVDLHAWLVEYKTGMAENYSLHQETALAALFSDFRSRRDWAKYRCDLLVCRRDGPPLFVLEFDGPHHEDADRKAREATRDRDLAAAGLTVLRVSYRNPETETSRSQLERAMARVLPRLLQALIDGFELERRAMSRSFEAEDTDPTGGLGSDPADGANLDGILDSMDEAQFAKRLVDPSESPLLNGRRVLAESLRVERTQDGGRRAHVQPADRSKGLSTPAYYFALSLSPGLRALAPYLDGVLDDVVRMDALSMAGNRD